MYFTQYSTTLKSYWTLLHVGTILRSRVQIPRAHHLRFCSQFLYHIRLCIEVWTKINKKRPGLSYFTAKAALPTYNMGYNSVIGFAIFLFTLSRFPRHIHTHQSVSPFTPVHVFMKHEPLFFISTFFL